MKENLTLQKIAYSKTDSDLIAKQKGTYKERGTKRKEEEKKKKKGKDAKGAPTVPSASAASGEKLPHITVVCLTLWERNLLVHCFLQCPPHWSLMLFYR